jgi:hypothetical protein
LSRKTKIGLGGGGLVIVVCAIITGLIAPPTDNAVRSFVVKQLAKDGLEVDNLWINKLSAPGDPLRLEISALARLKAGVRYETVSVETLSLPAVSIEEQDEWRRVREQIRGKEGVRLAALAGLAAADTELLNARIVRELKTAPGSYNPDQQVTGIFTAERKGLGWGMAFERHGTPPEDGTTPVAGGSTGPDFVIDRAGNLDRLIALLHRLPAIRDKLDRAVNTLLTEAKLRWLTLLQPQTLFAGTVEVSEFGKKHKASIYLEVTETRPDEDPPRLSALLRNDGGWQESRLFDGRIIYDYSSGRFQLKLTSSAGESAHGAGPFLEDHAPGFGLSTDADGDVVLPLLLEAGALVWKSGAATLRLEPVREDARAALITNLQGDDRKLREATDPGKAYLGTVTSRAKGTKDTWLLRFGPQDATTPEDDEDPSVENQSVNDENFTARLEHPENRNWKCALRGTLLANRYRAKGLPLRLQQDHRYELSPLKEISDLFGSRGNNVDESGPGIGLRLDRDKLVGENSRFVFEFVAATPEAVAAIEKKWVDDTEAERRQLLAATSPDAIYRGTVTTRSGSRREEFLLRFIEPEDSGNDLQSRAKRALRGAGAPAPPVEKRDDVLRARIEHPDHPTWRRVLTGRLQLDPEKAENFPVLLNTTGHTDSGKEARKNSFLDDNYQEIRLRSDGNGLTGESSAYRFHFDRLTSEAAAQLQQRDNALRARLLAFIQPGAAHDGTLKGKDAKPGLLRLRFLKLENNGEKVEAILQSRLRPQFAWRMTGSCNLAEFRLELTTGSSYDTTGLNADPDFQQSLRHFGGNLIFFWDNDAVGGYLGSPPDGWKFHFQPSTPEQLAQQRKEEAEREARLLAFVQPGTLHDGTVERADGTTPGLLRLRIVKMENRGERVEAVLHSRTRPRYVLNVTGKCNLSDGTLRLQWSGEPTRPALVLSSDPDLREHFRNFGIYNGSLVLSLEQNPVSGTHNNTSFRFAPSTPARLAELQKEEADRLARALAFVQTGTEHEGTVGRDGGVSGKVRLRILKMDDRGKRIEARLESAQSPQYAQKLTGRLALDGRLLLAQLDRNPSDPNGRLLFDDPALRSIYPNGYYSNNEFELAFTDTALEGNLDGNTSQKLTFPLR